jgi:16S rRNA processing protein RimM
VGQATGSPPPAPDGTTGRLQAGRVGRPHGLDGSFYVTRPLPRLLSLGTPVTMGGSTVAIVRRSGTEQRPIIRVEGVSTREGAESLRGEALLVTQATTPELAPGEYWAHELEGCDVLDGAHRVGAVTRMLELPSCEALEVSRDGAGALLVPMVSDAIREIDVVRRRIDIDLGFLGEAAPDAAGAPASEAPTPEAPAPEAPVAEAHAPEAPAHESGRRA